MGTTPRQIEKEYLFNKFKKLITFEDSVPKRARGKFLRKQFKQMYSSNNIRYDIRGEVQKYDSGPIVIYWKYV